MYVLCNRLSRFLEVCGTFFSSLIFLINLVFFIMHVIVRGRNSFVSFIAFCNFCLSYKDLESSYHMRSSYSDLCFLHVISFSFHHIFRIVLLCKY